VDRQQLVVGELKQDHFEHVPGLIWSDCQELGASLS